MVLNMAGKGQCQENMSLLNKDQLLVGKRKKQKQKTKQKRKKPEYRLL